MTKDLFSCAQVKRGASLCEKEDAGIEIRPMQNKKGNGRATHRRRVSSLTLRLHLHISRLSIQSQDHNPLHHVGRSVGLVSRRQDGGESMGGAGTSVPKLSQPKCSASIRERQKRIKRWAHLSKKTGPARTCSQMLSHHRGRARRPQFLPCSERQPVYKGRPS